MEHALNTEKIVAELRAIIRSEIEVISCPYLKPDQAAAYLGISKETLANLRMAQKGPKFSKPLPQVVLYHRDDLEAWVKASARLVE